MNNLRTMRFLFNFGRRSQQMMMLFNQGKPNRMKSVLSFVSMMMSTVAVIRKATSTLRTERQPLQNIPAKNTGNNVTALRPAMAEFAEEFMKDINQDKKKQDEQ